VYKDITNDPLSGDIDTFLMGNVTMRNPHAFFLFDFWREVVVNENRGGYHIVCD